MGSGVIYAMVIGLWALVLLPTWLRNHEQVDEGKQVDRFRRAMTQLSASQMEMLTQSQHKVVEAKRAPRAGVDARRPQARMTAAARRRRVLAVLGALQVVGLLAGLLGLGWPAMALPAMLIASFLTLARSQVRAERARRAPAGATAPATSASPLQGTFARTLAAARAARAQARTVDVVEQAPAAPTVAAPASWQPVRTPAPSYVSAPAATAVPRAIDAAGGWTGTAMVQAARVQATEAARAMAEEPVPVQQVQAPAAQPAFDVDITTEIPAIRTA